MSTQEYSSNSKEQSLQFEEQTIQTLQNEEELAKKSCRCKMIEYIISQINYKKEKGISALVTLDDDLYYLTQSSRIKFYITLPEYFESESWLFTTNDLLKYKSDLSTALQQHCSLGWFNINLLEDENKPVCSIFVSKRR